MRRIVINTFAILSVFAIFFHQCKKEEFGDGRAEDIPSSVDLGQSRVYINGEQLMFTSEFVIWTVGAGISGFCQRKNDGVVDDVQFYIDPIQTGSKDPKIGFARSKGDSSFENFEQIEKDSAFLEITTIDTVKMEVAGHFEARFKKTDSVKLTRKKKYPDEILIQGVFHETYTKF